MQLTGRHQFDLAGRTRGTGATGFSGPSWPAGSTSSVAEHRSPTGTLVPVVPGALVAGFLFAFAVVVIVQSLGRGG